MEGGSVRLAFHFDGEVPRQIEPADEPDDQLSQVLHVRRHHWRAVDWDNSRHQMGNGMLFDEGRPTDLWHFFSELFVDECAAFP
jgi:hypothetical protein